MDKPEAIATESQLDELTYEPSAAADGNSAMSLILESRRRRQPTLTIR
jgi:hypothetical protein